MKQSQGFFLAAGFFLLSGVIQFAMSNAVMGASSLPIAAMFFAIGASKKKAEDGGNAG